MQLRVRFAKAAAFFARFFQLGFKLFSFFPCFCFFFPFRYFAIDKFGAFLQEQSFVRFFFAVLFVDTLFAAPPVRWQAGALLLLFVPCFEIAVIRDIDPPVDVRPSWEISFNMTRECRGEEAIIFEDRALILFFCDSLASAH